jgi:hypothetical protein
MSRLVSALRGLGPYGAIALILPGGSLIALALWTIPHRTSGDGALRRLLLVVAVLGASLFLPGST